jgi:hypothetical protein
MCCLPGRIARASSPMMSPATMKPMMPMTAPLTKCRVLAAVVPR